MNFSLLGGTSDITELTKWYSRKKGSKRVSYANKLSEVCVFQCQPTALLRASDSTQGGEMALSVVYFRITHRLGRPQYVWDEYLNSVREKVEVRVTVSVTVCALLLCCVG